MLYNSNLYQLEYTVYLVFGSYFSVNIAYWFKVDIVMVTEIHCSDIHFMQKMALIK